MAKRLSAFDAKINIPVIKSAVINQFSTRQENGGLRSHLGAGNFHQGTFRIAKHSDMISVFLRVLANNLCRLIRVRINEPKLYAYSTEPRIEALYLRRILV